jgi:hypothetical protein
MGENTMVQEDMDNPNNKNKIRNIKKLRKIVMKSIKDYLKFILPTCKIRVTKGHIDGNFFVYIKRKGLIFTYWGKVCEINLYGKCSVKVFSYKFYDLSERIASYLNINTLYKGDSRWYYDE